MQAAGCIGHLRVDMDSTGTGFFSSWGDLLFAAMLLSVDITNGGLDFSKPPRH